MSEETPKRSPLKGGPRFVLLCVVVFASLWMAVPLLELSLGDRSYERQTGLVIRRDHRATLGRHALVGGTIGLIVGFALPPLLRRKKP